MIFMPRDQHRMQRPIEIVPRADAGGEHRLDGILDRGRTDTHAGLAQRPREIDDVVGDMSVRCRLSGFRARRCHGAYSAAESSALTSLRIRRPSPCSMRAMSSWYFRSTPIVSDTVSGSRATLSSSVSAPAQSMV